MSKGLPALRVALLDGVCAATLKHGTAIACRPRLQPSPQPHIAPHAESPTGCQVQRAFHWGSRLSNPKKGVTAHISLVRTRLPATFIQGRLCGYRALAPLSTGSVRACACQPLD